MHLHGPNLSLFSTPIAGSLLTDTRGAKSPKSGIGDDQSPEAYSRLIVPRELRYGPHEGVAV